MGCQALMTYASQAKLFKQVCLGEMAEQHRRKTGEEAVIAVDGPRCVWYLYQNCDFCCGGQYREFREACRNFVRAFRDCGVRLVFFFHGISPAEKNENLVQVSKDKVEELNQRLQKLDVGVAGAVNPSKLPEGLIPCARVILRHEPSTEVRLCLEDYYRETAEYAASCKNCLGVMSSNENFLVYKDVPRLFTFDKNMRVGDGVKTLGLSSLDITTDLDLEPEDMPAFATFLGNGTIDPDDLQQVHKRLGSGYEKGEELCRLVARLVKNRTVEEMCEIAFGDRWHVLLDRVRAGIEQYEYKQEKPGNDAKRGTEWSRVLQSIEAKHKSGEIPAVLLSVARHQTCTIHEVLEDFSQARTISTGEALRHMSRRMYTVLLWDGGDGPFRVKELVGTSTETCQQQVKVQKWLPQNLVHPGLLKLWTGDLGTRWRLFSWIVGASDPEGSALRSLEPQCLVVPAAALTFLRHEAHLLSPREALIFAVVAATVGKFSPQQLAQKRCPLLDPRAVFLSKLFVCTALHVLDAAAVCGLSFPREADCQLDAYFDGKFFHELYLKAKAQSFPGIETYTLCDPSSVGPVHKLLDVIEGTNIARQ